MIDTLFYTYLANVMTLPKSFIMEYKTLLAIALQCTCTCLVGLSACHCGSPQWTPQSPTDPLLLPHGGQCGHPSLLYPCLLCLTVTSCILYILHQWGFFSNFMNYLITVTNLKGAFSDSIFWQFLVLSCCKICQWTWFWAISCSKKDPQAFIRKQASNRYNTVNIFLYASQQRSAGLLPKPVVPSNTQISTIICINIYVKETIKYS